MGVTFSQSTATPSKKVTIGSLLANDDVSRNDSTASGAPGMFLRNSFCFYVCFIAETPQSAIVATRYGKTVE